MAVAREIAFTVDSQLLRELGERLVGRQYIALAELVKNSYDADATKVEIRFENDCITVSDNGHGMTAGEFERRWMRVGSTHKKDEVTSRVLGRPLTGSKGVGRLSVQFLAGYLDLVSAPKIDTTHESTSPSGFHADVDWDSAVDAGELTSATAQFRPADPGSDAFPLGNPHGTTVRLTRLKQPWTADEFERLAREIWFLQPPFRAMTGTGNAEEGGFEVDLAAPDPEIVSRFQTQMSRIMDLYRSRIVGRLLPADATDKTPCRREVQLSLELNRGPAQPHKYSLPVGDTGPCLIDSLEFEIRVLNLAGRQGYGIHVQTARDYMSQWGGVHIYDAGFRIPYAGPDADWLRLEVDHSHRRNRSDLLPEDLQVRLGLNHLPRNSRVLGVVNINTSHEEAVAQPDGSAGIQGNQHLQIQVSRDRLVSNDAFQQMRDAVRYALDYYATRLRVKQMEEATAERTVETPASLAQNVWDVLFEHENEIPKPVVAKLKTELEKTIDAVRDQSEWSTKQSGLLGAMATAGATAMAFNHQFNQQLNVLEHHATELANAANEGVGLTRTVAVISENIHAWIRDARNTRSIFSPVADERNRTATGRFKAKPLIASLAGNLRPILREVTIEVNDVDADLLLPHTSYPVWMAIFNNVFMNAHNAVLDSDSKRISVSSFMKGRRAGIRIQDTGVGIDLEKSETLFQPLQRSLEISSDRRELGYGGTGLGLAIIRMLATDVKADVCFVEPTVPFMTCFEMAWTEGS